MCVSSACLAYSRCLSNCVLWSIIISTRGLVQEFVQGWGPAYPHWEDQASQGEGPWAVDRPALLWSGWRGWLKVPPGRTPGLSPSWGGDLHISFLSYRIDGNQTYLWSCEEVSDSIYWVFDSDNLEASFVPLLCPTSEQADRKAWVIPLRCWQKVGTIQGNSCGPTLHHSKPPIVFFPGSLWAF